MNQNRQKNWFINFKSIIIVFFIEASSWYWAILPTFDQFTNDSYMQLWSNWLIIIIMMIAKMITMKDESLIFVLFWFESKNYIKDHVYGRH